MSNDEARALARSLAILAWEERRDRVDDHPTPERLAAYHSEELSPEEDLEIQQHLVLCTDCPALLLDLEDLFDPRHRDLGLSDNGVTSAWRDLRSRLGGNRGGKGGGLSAVPARSWRSWLTAIPSPVYATVMSLLFLLTAGLAVRNVVLERHQVRPVADPQSVPLAVSQERGSPPAVPELKFLPGDQVAMLKVTPREDSHAPYRVQVLDREGQTIVSSSSLNEPDVYIPVILTRDSVKPGIYTVRVVGHTEQGRETEQEHEFEVVLPSDPHTPAE